MMPRSIAAALLLGVALTAGCGGAPAKRSDIAAVERAFHAYLVANATGNAARACEAYTGRVPAAVVQHDVASCHQAIRVEAAEHLYGLEARWAAAGLRPDKILVKRDIATISFTPPPDLPGGWLGLLYMHRTAHGWQVESDHATKCSDGELVCPS
jgi:hypothetical protein